MLFLFETFKERVKLSERDCTLISRRFQFHNLSKKEQILLPGQPCDFLLMVQSGCLRSYIIDMQDREFNLQFGYHGGWVTDIKSFRSGNPSAMTIEAIEKTEVWMIEESDLQLLLEEVPVLRQYFLTVSVRMLGLLQDRLTSSVTMTAKEHYRLMSDSSSELLRRIPQYHLASYLGITPDPLTAEYRLTADDYI